ncbi:MAG: hypothetical protein LBQ71_14700 [Hungatella sp.]|nr:hypothetical protein [Hungatella sp.]
MGVIIVGFALPGFSNISEKAYNIAQRVITLSSVEKRMAKVAVPSRSNFKVWKFSLIPSVSDRKMLPVIPNTNSTYARILHMIFILLSLPSALFN